MGGDMFPPCCLPGAKLGFPCGSESKASVCNAGDLGSIPGLGRSPGEGNGKECLNYCTIALISHASKVMLKILQARLQQYVN